MRNLSQDVSVGEREISFVGGITLTRTNGMRAFVLPERV